MSNFENKFGIIYNKQVKLDGILLDLAKLNSNDHRIAKFIHSNFKEKAQAIIEKAYDLEKFNKFFCFVLDFTIKVIGYVIKKLYIIKSD